MELQKFFREKVLNEEVRVVLKDGRVIFGRLTCIDQKANLVVQESIMQVDPAYIAPVNDTLHFLISRYNNYSARFANKPDEEESFGKDKHYLGSIVIPGQEIESFGVKREEDNIKREEESVKREEESVKREELTA